MSWFDEDAAGKAPRGPVADRIAGFDAPVEGRQGHGGRFVGQCCLDRGDIFRRRTIGLIVICELVGIRGR